MLTTERKRRIVIIGMFRVPVGLVKGTAVFYGAGAPAGAEAATSKLTPVEPADVARQSSAWSPQHRAAAERVAALCQQPVGPSPLLHNVSADDGTGSHAVEPGAPNLLVQAILASPEGSTALLNGRMYRVGDTFDGTDWKVTAINNESRSVTLTNTSNGNEITRAVKMRE